MELPKIDNDNEDDDDDDDDDDDYDDDDDDEDEDNDVFSSFKRISNTISTSGRGRGQ